MNKEQYKQQFIEKAKLLHNNKYDYSKVDYQNNKTKVCIICHKKDENGIEHGEFWQRPNDHISSKAGCPKCKKVFRYDTKSFIEKAKNIHGSKYNYDKVDYINNKTKVVIICPLHGEFEQTPSDHLQGHGCPHCANQKLSEIKFIGTQQFIEKANKVHNNKYDYSLSDYKGCYEKIRIICPIHGEFQQEAHNHLRGQGCPKCNQSKGEKTIETYLQLNNINYINQYEIPIDKNINISGIAKIDFYLPDYNLYIEYNGIQHYIPMKYFGGELEFKHQQERDKYVKNYCGNKLIEIKYNCENIDGLLNSKIFNANK